MINIIIAFDVIVVFGCDSIRVVMLDGVKERKLIRCDDQQTPLLSIYDNHNKHNCTNVNKPNPNEIGYLIYTTKLIMLSG